MLHMKLVEDDNKQAANYFAVQNFNRNVLQTAQSKIKIGLQHKRKIGNKIVTLNTKPEVVQ